MRKINILTVLMLAIVINGCSMLSLRKAEMYDMSYDQTYLITLDALDDMDPWYLVETDHLNGKIKIEDKRYLTPDRSFEVIVKRIAPYKTKVELYNRWATPWNQKFFTAIDKRVETRAVTYVS